MNYFGTRMLGVRACYCYAAVQIRSVVEGTLYE